MQFSPKVNTAILSLYILVVISFTVLSVSVTSVVGLMNWGLMLGIMVWLLFQINLRPLFLFLGMTVIYFAIHLLVADTSPLAAGLFFANILLYLCLPYFRVQPEKIAGMLFALMIINALVGIKEILYSPFAGTVSEYFKGFFQNANTNGNFACCTLAAGLLFFKGKKQRFFLICLFVIYLFACKSRNALLFALITMFMYVLLSHRRFVRLAVWGYFLFFAACLLYLIVIEPMNLGEGVKVFGKEAESAGRSTQVLMAIARFPVPVFTAVGHDQDHHVCDMVAYGYMKTPTAMADELIGYYADEDARLLSFGSRLKLAFLNKISRMESQVQMLETRIRSADPRNILRRGYVLALDSSGVPFKKAADKSCGDEVSLMFADGTLECRVTKVTLAGRPD